MIDAPDRLFARTRAIALACLAAATATFAAGQAAPPTAGSGATPAGAGTPVVNVRELGALGDGTTNDTAALQRAIDTAAERGGVALVPAGTYRCGPLALKSNLTLQLEAGATLQAIPGDVVLYPIGAAPWEGHAAKAHLSVLHAENAQNIRITGKGTIDGSGQWWWDNYRTFTASRPRLVEFLKCRGITVSGVHLKDSPGWNLHPVFSEDIKVEGVTITAPESSHNTDGINPNGSRNVTISGCTIDVGDDCIAIKSGMDVPAEERRPTENVIVRDCLMKRGHGGVTIGSETCGDVRHVLVSNCVFEGTDNGVRLKSKRGRGGTDDDIVYENIEFKNVKTGVHMTLRYGEKGEVKFQAVDAGTPTMGGITMRNIRGTATERIGFIEGLPERPIKGVFFENVQLSSPKGLELINVTDVRYKDVKFDIQSGEKKP
jgi:polygalacturonase